MTIQRMILAAALAALPAATTAHAAASLWHHVEGGAIRIVTSGAPDESGLLRGALEIRLNPGWKTYWLDPGGSGIPPTLAISANGTSAAVEIDFPAPRRFDDGYAQWTGYDRSVALALTMQLPDAAPLEVDAFLGLCETICIPVQATLAIDPRSGADEPAHRLVVASAFGALPGPARPGFEASIVDATDTMLRIGVTAPRNVDVLDLYVAGDGSRSFALPVKSEQDGQIIFSLARTGGGTGGMPEALPYTLVTTAGAVSGQLDLP